MRLTRPFASARSIRPTALWWQKQEVAGDVPDRGAGWLWVAFDREEQLVLGGREVLRAGLLLAPAQESAQAGSELEQAPVVGIGGRRRISWRDSVAREHRPRPRKSTSPESLE